MEIFKKIIMNYSNIELSIFVYIIVINLAAYVIMGIDKLRAKKGQWRVREGALMLVSLLGGATGTMLGMVVFKHKTNKKKFSIGVPILYLINWIITFLVIGYIR